MAEQIDYDELARLLEAALDRAPSAALFVLVDRSDVATAARVLRQLRRSTPNAQA